MHIIVSFFFFFLAISQVKWNFIKKKTLCSIFILGAMLLSSLEKKQQEKQFLSSATLSIHLHLAHIDFYPIFVKEC